jgi:DNA polymerase-3 subunit gamma/tau
MPGEAGAPGRQRRADETKSPPKERMSYLVIARKWRPQTFEDVVGQSHVTRTLQNAISAGRVAHAYLFTGPRGVGKTSTARILAKALNCEKGPTAHPCLECAACREIAGPGSVDVMEIDGASNNSVDDIRSLREKVMYTGVRDRHKVYIIDEVHMLSGAAFNALLKTLEEPPPHVIFIFATTEVQKLPETILSRTQRFDFRRVAPAELAAALDKIMKAEGVETSADALLLVARSGGGSVRDSQTLLDQVISYALGSDEKRALRVEDVLAVLGGVQEGSALGALEAALKGDAPTALQWLAGQYDRGADLRQVLEAFQDLLRGLLLAKADPDRVPDADLLPETAKALRPLAAGLGLSRIFSALKACNEAENQLRYSSQARLVLEMLLVQFGPASPGAGIGDIVDELRDLEQKLRTLPEAAALPAPAPAPAAPPAAVEQLVPVTAPAGVQSVPEVVSIPADPGVPQPAVEEVEVPAAPAGLDLARLQSDWEALGQAVAERSLNLAAAVSGAALAGLEAGVVSLRVGNAYQRQVLETPAEREQLESLLSARYGQPLRVQVLLAQAGARAVKGAKPAPEAVEKLLKERPEVRKVQELFGAEIVEISEEE